MKILSCEALKYNIHLLVIQEMQWIGHSIMDRRDYSVLYSCHDKDHTLSTRFLVGHKLKPNVNDFKHYNPRPVSYTHLDVYKRQDLA